LAHATAKESQRTTPAGVPDAVAVMSKAGSENFTVASRLLPKAQREHLLAVYGFARLADDIGDEADGDRLALLGWLDAELKRAAPGQATHPALVRLGSTICACHLPLDPFERLIEANRRDQVVTRYATFDDLVGYCELSANPIGELVLRIFDVLTPPRLALSDRVCTGLQITEHLQDVGEDARRGRVYLPADELARFGCSEADLVAAAASPPLRAVVLAETARARELLDTGAQLAATLRGRVRVAVAGFAAGGHAVLDAIEHAGGDVLSRRCRPRPDRTVARLVRILADRTVPPS
jgi:squalene synthase HpnC